MENWSRWNFVRAGFWIGIGLIIPQTIGTLVETGATIYAYPLWLEAAFESQPLRIAEGDLTDQIEIVNFREQYDGEALYLMGTIKNQGGKGTRSIRLHAQLSDEDGAFVYECEGNVVTKLEPGNSEKFQFGCGRGSDPIPDYADIDLRIVGIVWE